MLEVGWWEVGGHQGIFAKASENMGWIKAKVVHRGEGV